MLRITADKNTAEYAAHDIEEALRNVKSAPFQLKPWVPLLAEGKVPKGNKLTALYSQNDLEMVTTLTRASVHVAPHDRVRYAGMFQLNYADSNS